MIENKPIVIHQTDLFHSYNDPDDHWDLACQFALAYCKEIELRSILIDYPPIQFGDPSIQSVHQMNYMTGLSVPVAVGIQEPMKASETYVRSDGFTPGYSGIDMLLTTMEQAERPLIIHIVGSCRDVAIAATLNPALFEEKCKAIYLNAGSSSPKSKLEYNVSLDPYSYSVIWGLQCPIYWMPCFEFAPEPPDWEFRMGRYGTFYRFMQEDILPYLSENVQKYFLYALSKSTDNRWLSYLQDPIHKRQLDFFSKLDRSMYSTGGFFHAAGKSITRNGEIVRLDEGQENAVYTYEPIEISCDDMGNVMWHVAQQTSNRFIFKVNDLSVYPAAMTSAVKSLLMTIP